MKITFLTPNLELHGGNLVMLKYANYLANNGHEITIISSDKITLTDISPKIKILTYKSFPVKYVDFFLLQKIYFSKIINLIQESDFLIPIYTPLLPAVIKAKITKKLKAKIILLFQDFFEMIWTGSWIKKMLSNSQFTKYIKTAVCVSNGAQEELKSISNIKTVVIVNGIESERFHPRKINKQNYLLFVGRPSSPKGFSYFKKAFQLAKNKYPDLTAKVIGPNLKNKKIDQIEYISFQNRDQLAKLYNQALVYINTSPGESFGIPALEAMSSGTAVVLTDTVGSKQYAKNNLNSIVVPINNADKIAGAILKIIESKTLREKLQTNGLITAKNYAWEKSLDKFYRLLLNLN